jgi:hypothetical protein
MANKITEHHECFGSEPDRLRIFPQTFIRQIQAKGIEDDAFFVLRSSHRMSTLRIFSMRMGAMAMFERLARVATEYRKPQLKFFKN